MKRKEQKKKLEVKEKPEVTEGSCNDRDCPFHGNLKVRGRAFEGEVKKKFPRRVALEFERMIYIRKYERYAKAKTKVHARLPSCMIKQINVGDIIRVQECRPLSKIIHFVVLKKLKESEHKIKQPLKTKNKKQK
ncbi:30S ribosomal protein S17 [Patescibacteria group bacterium]|nr:30S ribosomal protein S17 [Patescibacteria group bacterium]